ncbi:necap-like protein [Anaeramoeba flamelloides]|uniref:Necap-like protein n=1 Tax=Anaeramoeba flamelloides TaxID=1746091 RepID=A0AAV7ZU00_9EUKA|nr:necap-like protein [Anaeramoeba flamelloides]
MEQLCQKILLTINECRAYKIYEIKNNNQYKAQDFFEDICWVGSLKVLLHNKECYIQLEDTVGIYKTLKYDSKANVLQSIDSGRFFILNDKEVESDHLLAISFDKRSDSFDFRFTLDQYLEKHKKNINNQKQIQKEEDLKLRPDKQIRVNLSKVTIQFLFSFFSSLLSSQIQKTLFLW